MAVTKILSGAFLIFLTSCTDRPAAADCYSVKTGSFKLKENAGIPAFMVSRTQSRQYETNLETGEKRIFRVKWINECEYELRLVKKFGGNKKIKQSTFRDSIELIPSTIRIIMTSDNYYIFEISKKDLPTYSDTLWKEGNSTINNSDKGDIL